MAKKKTDAVADPAPESAFAAPAPAEPEATNAAPTNAAPAGDLEADVSDGQETPPTNTEPTAPATPAATPAVLARSGEEIRAAAPSALSDEEIEQDLTPLVAAVAERERVTRDYADLVRRRAETLAQFDRAVNLAADERRSFEERYVVLGERLRLLNEEKARRARAAQQAAAQAEQATQAQQAAR